MKEAKRRPDPQHIIQTNAALNGLTVKDITGRGRLRFVVAVRQEIETQLHEAEFGYREIGSLLGGRDHSTIFWGVRRALARRESMPADLGNASAVVVFEGKKQAKEKKVTKRQQRIERKATEKDKNRRIAEIALAIIAAHYGVTIEEMLSKRRTKRLVQPRHSLQYILSQLTTLGLRQIANVVGRTDHTTTSNAIERVEEQLEKSEEFRERMEILITEIKEAT